LRARNIKPSLFKNEILGTADPLLTILFEGLWCEADRDGRLEDRPLRLKAEIFPYRNDADIDVMLNWLSLNGFISRYEAQNTKVIQVLKFSDHQRPHNNEVASVLPPMEASKHTQGKKSARPRKKALRSDSPSLIPDSLNLDSAQQRDAPLHDSLPRKNWEEWLSWRRSKRMPCDPLTLAKQLGILAKISTQEQIETIERSIQANWQGLFPEKRLNGKHIAPAPNHDAAWAEARSRAKAIGFRDPFPQESPGAYMTDIKLAESSPRTGPHSLAALTQKMRVGA
jgi:hypothetical protein